jgi:hypothetical protein
MLTAQAVLQVIQAHKHRAVLLAAAAVLETMIAQVAVLLVALAV